MPFAFTAADARLEATRGRKARAQAALESRLDEVRERLLKVAQEGVFTMTYEADSLQEAVYLQEMLQEEAVKVGLQEETLTFSWQEALPNTLAGDLLAAAETARDERRYAMEKKVAHEAFHSQGASFTLLFPSMEEARREMPDWLQEEMQEAGFTVEVDTMGSGDGRLRVAW